MSYATVAYSEMGHQILVVQLLIDNMDDPGVISTLVAAGRVPLDQGQVPDMISMDITRQGLLANGYIQ